MIAAIMLASVKIPYDEIRRRIVEVDEENLGQSMLEQLVKYMPEPEQLKQIATFKDQYDDLAESEQFCVKVSSRAGFLCQGQFQGRVFCVKVRSRAGFSVSRSVQGQGFLCQGQFKGRVFGV